ncbi:MAG TPA: glycosyltransferase family 4 protein, partial [Flavobacterium sp.]|nr:glycosyltransferase family 4 protein [Flavobacterium sp.]
VVFIWFADYHSFFPILFAKVMGKKSFVVIGGYDVARMPELNYGVFISKIRGFCAAFSMRKSYTNLAVSQYVERRVRKISHGNKTKLIYNCFNIQDSDVTDFYKENLIITVGLIDSKRSFILKGIDTFIETARSLQDYKFLIIGIDSKVAKEHIYDAPKNLKTIELVKHEELAAFYKKAKIYCQFSRSESFGVSVVEAIYNSCIPLVTNIGGLPEIVGDKKYLTKRENEEIKDKLECLSNNMPVDELTALKLRIDSIFSLEKRKINLLKTCE